jgi:mono/diheme cytochrome c family protein
MNRRLSIGIAAVFFSSVLAAGARDLAQTRPPTPPREDPASGAYMYKTFCASCHGETGRGDGTVSDLLRQKPNDLQRLAESAGGTFPRERVARIIDGRTPLAGHDRAGMPVWGDVFRTTEGTNERAIARRIDALVAHLESLQVRR